MPPEQREQSLPLRGRRLARELRKRREDAGLKPEEAADRLGFSRSKLNRVENARNRISVEDCEAVLDLYGVSGADRAEMLTLAAEADRRGWWEARSYSGIFTGSYVAFENDAALIRDWGVQLLPGLLQTPEYAREVIRAGLPDASEDDINRRVQARMARKPLLSRTNAPTLHAVVDEAVFHRQIGTDGEWRAQLESLLTAMRRDNVALQVLPFSAGVHAGMEGSFILLSFPDDVDPDVAYVEGTAGTVYVESAVEVSRYTLAYGRVVDAALSPEKSAEFISGLIKE